MQLGIEPVLNTRQIRFALLAAAEVCSTSSVVDLSVATFWHDHTCDESENGAAAHAAVAVLICRHNRFCSSCRDVWCSDSLAMPKYDVRVFTDVQLSFKAATSKLVDTLGSLRHVSFLQAMQHARFSPETPAERDEVGMCFCSHQSWIEPHI